MERERKKEGKKYKKREPFRGGEGNDLTWKRRKQGRGKMRRSVKGKEVTSILMREENET